MIKLWKWQNGRQMDCEYKKLPLWYFKIGKFGFDCYILKYNDKQFLPLHVDPIENGKHWRLNIGWGESEFYCKKLIFGKKFGKLSLYLFRPDLYKHSLCTMTKTTKISFGFARFKKL